MEDIALFIFYKNGSKYIVDVVNKAEPKIYTYDAINIKRKLEELKNYIDSKCFAYFYPWQTILDLDSNNKVIIAFNMKTNVIQAWCDFYYEKHNNIYTLKLNGINTRVVPKLKGLGTYIINFIKDNYMSQVLYNDEIVDIHLLYLFALRIANGFYKSKGLGLTEYKHGNGESTFYYLAKELNESKLEKFKAYWKETHNTPMEQHDILDYNQEIHNIKYHTDCINPKSRVSFFTKSKKSKSS